jgi:hypothetical protein
MTMSKKASSPSHLLQELCLTSFVCVFVCAQWEYNVWSGVKELWDSEAYLLAVFVAVSAS